ncbi:MAG: hypothetical protein ABJB22_03880 [Verrucomicrobiota bacterium]
MNNSSLILQIVPRAPGSHDGVGDYALTLAKQLMTHHGRKTVFAMAERPAVSEIEDFEILSPLEAIDDERCRDRGIEAIILHYVNYGYQDRGVPLSLPPLLRKLRRACGGPFVTVFHEIHASGPPWKSAFWLRPLQIRIAREIAEISATCVVSSETTRDQLHRIAPQARIVVHPVISNFGEPDLSPPQFAGRDQHRWAICGGTHLVERSLRSFLRRVPSIPGRFSPRDLFVFGGKESAIVRKTLDKIAKIKCHYSPQVEVSLATGILSFCAFGWIDYFDRANVPTAAILKSTTFAAYCAHGVIPVFPEAGSEIALDGDRLPSPCYVAQDRTDLPAESEREKISHEIYTWYQRRASSERLAAGIAAALS